MDAGVVHVLADTSWDFAPREGGWIPNAEVSRPTGAAARALYDAIPERLTEDEAKAGLLRALETVDMTALERDFERAGATGSYRHLSPYATAHFLQHATLERLPGLQRTATRSDCLRQLFLKLFRGGTIERGHLLYSYCDLVIELPDVPLQVEPWLPALLDEIEAREPATLTELLACARPHTKGNKSFRKTLLQALSYARILVVEGYGAEVYLPTAKASPGHFHSRDWTTPLCMWPERGGCVRR